ncbi:MAG: hypothetical protein VX100_02560 [Pseudomonadota bacterium]|nr:hypothetical protein [Pseudomonadota bacterium]
MKNHNDKARVNVYGKELALLSQYQNKNETLSAAINRLIVETLDSRSEDIKCQNNIRQK